MPFEPTPPADAVNLSQAARLVGYDRVSLWRWIKAGELPAKRYGRFTMVQEGDLREAVNRRKRR